MLLAPGVDQGLSRAGLGLGRSHQALDCNSARNAQGSAPACHCAHCTCVSWVCGLLYHYASSMRDESSPDSTKHQRVQLAPPPPVPNVVPPHPPPAPRADGEMRPPPSPTNAAAATAAATTAAEAAEEHAHRHARSRCSARCAALCPPLPAPLQCSAAAGNARCHGVT